MKAVIDDANQHDRQVLYALHSAVPAEVQLAPMMFVAA
jgi:hypothetical protein